MRVLALDAGRGPAGSALRWPSTSACPRRWVCAPPAGVCLREVHHDVLGFGVSALDGRILRVQIPFINIRFMNFFWLHISHIILQFLNKLYMQYNSPNVSMNIAPRGSLICLPAA